MSDTFFTPEEDLKRLSENQSKSNTSLPNVLIIGDSISMGYTPFVVSKLAGIANISRPLGENGGAVNCGDTNFGLREIQNWIGTKEWDVIHFNFGLHDLAYRHPDSPEYGNRDKINGTVSVTLEQYEKNLAQIVDVILHTGATAIWASTSKVPAGEAGRIEGDEINYNAVAKKIADAYKVAIDDLWLATSQFPSEFSQCPGDVHYTSEGSEALANHVVKAILAAL